VTSVIIFSAVNALAILDIDVPSGTVTYASELAGTGGTYTNSSNLLDVITNFGFSVTSSSAKYVRLDLGGGALFKTSNPTAVISAATGTTTTFSQGGLSKNYVIFEIKTLYTISTTSRVTFQPKAIGVSSTSPVTVTYGIYGDPGDAVAKTGVLYTKSGTLLSFTNGLVASATKVKGAVIDVAENSKKFEAATSGSSEKLDSKIGEPVVEIQTSPSTPIHPDTGVAVALTDFLTSEAYITVTGDFSCAQNDDGTYTGDALNRVFIDTSGNCDSVDIAASTLTANSAKFIIGDSGLTSSTDVCIKAEGTPEIIEGTYSATLTPGVSTTGERDFGDIGYLVDNGSTDMMNFALTPEGTYACYIRVSNLSSMAGDVFMTVYADSGAYVTFGISAIDGIDSDELPAYGSTDFLPSTISIDNVYKACTALDATNFPEGYTGKLRIRVKGAFAGGISIQGLTTAKSGDSFFMMKQ
jgi:hypothetical protein